MSLIHDKISRSIEFVENNAFQKKLDNDLWALVINCVGSPVGDSVCAQVGSEIGHEIINVQ